MNVISGKIAQIECIEEFKYKITFEIIFVPPQLSLNRLQTFFSVQIDMEDSANWKAEKEAQKCLNFCRGHETGEIQINPLPKDVYYYILVGKLINDYMVHINRSGVLVAQDVTIDPDE